MGVGMAELLASEGRPVRFVTPLPVAGPLLDQTDEAPFVRQRLADLGVETAVGTELVAVGTGDCVLRTYGRERTVRAEGVVLVTARVSNDRLRRELESDPEALQAAGVEALFAIGDCVAPRLIADCVFDGHRLAREIDSSDPRRPLPYLRERRLVSPAATAAVAN
jgi:dimethylamine/trimethylamine dehydrogenase